MQEKKVNKKGLIDKHFELDPITAQNLEELKKKLYKNERIIITELINNKHRRVK